MNIEEYRDYCIAKKGVTEGFPFDKSTLVFKVMGKMFALADVDNFDFINLKCDPEKAIELRESYNGIKPGYHMSKSHWNSVYVNTDVPDQLIFQLIDNSYQLIVSSLTKKLQAELKSL
ncbi:MAG: MmcQ/YjbR family DNA-binding protein [Flavobacteriales bacterium]|nr:MmcQ/YjbR family DNA-binding protein [Flavobacteriales bacterium]MCB9335677.1 MmcQ/YjbR family DNA-binding protein [Flavobacteriales bacterium]